MWKHPHGRGEDPVTSASPGTETETPPRTWGRPVIARPHRAFPRNTPTDVGKTRLWRSSPGPLRKHPHGRGEDRLVLGQIGAELETPPRTWGRRRERIAELEAHRNTPTDVGKTDDLAQSELLMEKHPHGRGEDRPRILVGRGGAETPPRTWGRHCGIKLLALSLGNTPTDVGKTFTQKGTQVSRRKHPHGRGEDSTII